MQDLDNSERQAQLREAAEALVGWMYARRAAWEDDLPFQTEPSQRFEAPAPFTPSPVFPAPPPMVAEPPVYESEATPLDAFSPFDYADEPTVAEPAFAEPVFAPPAPAIAKPSTPRFQPQVVIAAVSGLATSLAGGASRMVPSARAMKLVAVVAAVAVTGWLAVPYAGSVKTWVTEFANKAATPKPEPVPVKAARPAAGRRTGQLIAQSEPPGAVVLVDGKERGVTPLTLDDMSFGSHTVVLQSDKGSVRRTVKIAADRDAVVSESIFAGWLSVFAPFEVQVSEGTRSIRLDDTGKVLLAPGPHELRFENTDLGFRETRRVEVQPGQTTSLSLVTTPSTLTVTASAPAVVLIDGQQVGETPLTNYPIGLGTREILVRGADGAERRFTQRVTVAPVHIEVDFSKP